MKQTIEHRQANVKPIIVLDRMIAVQGCHAYQLKAGVTEQRNKKSPLMRAIIVGSVVD
jgi:hypothetical protein